MDGFSQGRAASTDSHKHTLLTTGLQAASVPKCSTNTGNTALIASPQQGQHAAFISSSGSSRPDQIAGSLFSATPPP